MAQLGAIISPKELAVALERDDVKCLDGSWVMPGSNAALPSSYIPGAQDFDIDGIADMTSPLQHMLPSQAVFETAVRAMGVSNDDTLVCYDRHGLFSAPRLWWTFKMFGHKTLFILDGGLPAWIDQGFPITSHVGQYPPSHYKAHAPLAKVCGQSDIMVAIDTDIQIVDARPAGRFNGTLPEPRPDSRSGHIPNSLNLPFNSLRAANGTFKSQDDCQAAITAANIDLGQPIITTCGSGITAAGLAFVFDSLGAQDVTVYDGSWAEWGSDKHLPINSGIEL